MNTRYLLAMVALIATAMPPAAIAQSAGDKVEYKVARNPDKWETGTFVKTLPGGTQVLIREKPNEFFKEGFERAYALTDVRPLGQIQPAPDQPEQRARPAPPKPSPPRVATAQSTQPAPNTPAERPADAAGGGNPMSQQDVLAFLRSRLGSGDPFMNPKREQVKQELRQEILRRGVAFRYTSIGPFANELGKVGATSDITAPLAENHGPPARLGSLFGTWDLIKVGATTTFSKGRDLYQRQEYAGNAGSLTLNANGSYVWDSPSGVLKGQWRKATPEEMAKSDKGGEGAVLLKAKSGADWLVFKRDEEGPQGQGIKITDLATRNLRERGTRR